MHRETSELLNSSECPWKFLEIFGNGWVIFGNFDTLQDKNFTPLAQRKLAGIWVGSHRTTLLAGGSTWSWHWPARASCLVAILSESLNDLMLYHYIKF